MRHVFWKFVAFLRSRKSLTISDNGKGKEDFMTTTSPPNTAFDIANWFLVKAKKEGKKLKHMKLQKLVYFAYGWYFAYFDEQLFPEKIYAWPLGTVVEELYHEHKHNKDRPIISDIDAHDIDDENVNFILEGVWEAYSPYNDMYLSGITHRTNSPWCKYFFNYEKNTPIPPEEIRCYFKDLKIQYDAITG